MTPIRQSGDADQVQTVNDCGKIRAECRESRAVDRRWQIGIIVGVLLSVVGGTIAMAMTNARTDANQDVRILTLEKVVEKTDFRYEQILQNQKGIQQALERIGRKEEDR